MRKMVPVILIIAVLFSSGCIIGKTWPPKDISDCRALEEDPGIYDGLYTPDECYFSIAIDTNNVTICGELDNAGEYTPDECYFSIAIDTNDDTVCDKLGTDGEYTSDGCFFTIALDTKDASTCDRLDNEGEYISDECYLAIAFETNDATVCDKLSIADESLVCTAKIAGRTGQYELCFGMNDTSYRHNCFYNCWEDCGSIETIVIDGNERDMSFGRIPGEINESVCRTALGNSTDPLFDPCIEIISKTDMDPDICDEREDDTAAVCRYYYSLYYVDADACESLGNRTYTFGSTSESTSGSVVLGETHYLGSFDREMCTEIIEHFRTVNMSFTLG